MTDPLNGKILFIDFDSTFVKVETIDELADLSLENDINKEEKINIIKDITNQAMSGKIDFPVALQKRLEILSLNLDNIRLITDRISNLVSDSFKRNRDVIKSCADRIWIVSGGFTQIICPIVAEYGIKDSHVIANTFVFDGDEVAGCDKSSALFKDKGKIHAISSIEANGDTVMLGDGYTDLEVYLEKAVSHFICYTENIKREKVTMRSEHIADSFDQVLKLLENI